MVIDCNVVLFSHNSGILEHQIKVLWSFFTFSLGWKQKLYSCNFSTIIRCSGHLCTLMPPTSTDYLFRCVASHCIHQDSAVAFRCCLLLPRATRLCRSLGFILCFGDKSGRCRCRCKLVNQFKRCSSNGTHAADEACGHREKLLKMLWFV